MIRFICDNAPYACGEVAGFDPETENRFLRAKVAVTFESGKIDSAQAVKPAAVSVPAPVPAPAQVRTAVPFFKTEKAAEDDNSAHTRRGRSKKTH